MRKWLQRAGMPSRKGYGFVEHCSNKRPDMMSRVPHSSILKTVAWDGVADLVQKLWHLRWVQLTVVCSMECCLRCWMLVISVYLPRNITGINRLFYSIRKGMSLLGTSGSLYIFMFSHMLIWAHDLIFFFATAEDRYFWYSLYWAGMHRTGLVRP